MSDASLFDLGEAATAKITKPRLRGRLVSDLFTNLLLVVCGRAEKPVTVLV